MSQRGRDTSRTSQPTKQHTTDELDKLLWAFHDDYGNSLSEWKNKDHDYATTLPEDEQLQLRPELKAAIQKWHTQQLKSFYERIKPEKMENGTGSLQEHEFVAMVELQIESLVPRKSDTLIFSEAALHRLVVKLIAEYHNKCLDTLEANAKELGI